MDEIGYSFVNPALMTLAMTHSSSANERKSDGHMSNERLEFLGDAILDAVVSENIYNGYPELTEGSLTRMRASLVCESFLADKARLLGLDKRLMMGHGERITGGSAKNAVLCDTFEAVVGAVFLDSGYAAARDWVVSVFAEDIAQARNSFLASDAKTSLQEELQKTSRDPIDYVTVNESGPDHDKTFAVEARYQGRVIGQGEGKTKKAAAQAAAKDALGRMNIYKEG